MPDKIKVGMADWKIAKTTDSLVTFGLGSCVALALWDRQDQVASMAHIMLPDSKLIRFRQEINPAKFADTALAEMIDKLNRQGYSKDRLVAKLVGGANMFNFAGKSLNANMNVGLRNTTAVKAELVKQNIPLVAEDTGGTTGRSIEFFADSGIIKIRTAMYGEKEI
jgi:chemotaxis protein CheD